MDMSDQNKIKITVVTVSYNAATTIEETILSVINQTYDNVEYIVIDGGSTDGTVDIIKKYADGGSEFGKHNHNIFYYVSEPDKGIYDAMNKGINVATGDYINFMNSGDRFNNNSVLSSVAPQLNGATIVAGIYNLCVSSGRKKLIKQGSLNLFKIRQPICHQATFIDVAYHKKHPYDTSLKCAADYNFFYKAWRKSQPIIYIEQLIADFMFDSGTSFSNYRTSIIERKKSWIGERHTWLRTVYLYIEILKMTISKFLHHR